MANYGPLPANITPAGFDTWVRGADAHATDPDAHAAQFAATAPRDPAEWAEGNAAYANIEQELGVAQVITAQTGIGSAATDVTGLSVAVTIRDRPIVVRAFLSIRQRTSAGFAQMTLFDVTAGAQVAGTQVSLGVDEYGFLSPWVRLNPAAGARTYKVRLLASAGTVDTVAGATSPNSIHVEEV